MSARTLREEAGEEGSADARRAHRASPLHRFGSGGVRPDDAARTVHAHAQGAWIDIAPDVFYQIMTAHGAGMVGVTGIASVAVMWFFLRKYVPLQPVDVRRELRAVHARRGGDPRIDLHRRLCRRMDVPLSAAGAFDEPVERQRGGAVHARLPADRRRLPAVLPGCDARGHSRYGNLGRALGLQWLFGGKIDKSHPPAVVASTMVDHHQLARHPGGAVVLVMSLINAYFPSVVLDALLVKNLTYFFGHVFINATIYMAVIAVYECCRAIADGRGPCRGRSLWALGSDHDHGADRLPASSDDGLRMPRWMLVMGQIISVPAACRSSGNGVWRARQRSPFRHQWDMPVKLVCFRCSGGRQAIVPAIVDGMISVNRVMHNTSGCRDISTSISCSG